MDSLQFLPTIGKIGVGAAGLLILALAGSSCQPAAKPLEAAAPSVKQEPTGTPKELQTATFAMG